MRFYSQTLAYLDFYRTFAPWFIHNSIGFRFNKTKEAPLGSEALFYVYTTKFTGLHFLISWAKNFTPLPSNKKIPALE